MSNRKVRWVFYFSLLTSCVVFSVVFLIFSRIPTAQPSTEEEYLGKQWMYWEQQLHPKGDSALEATENLLVSGGTTAVPILFEVLRKSKDSFARARALYCFGRIAKNADCDLSPILEQLSDQERIVRLATVEVLGDLGPYAKESVGRLHQQLRDGHADPELEISVMLALLQIDKDANQDLLSALEGKLEHNDSGIRICAIIALGKLGSVASPTTAALKKTLHDSVPSVRFASAEALWKINRDLQVVERTLIELLGGPNLVIRQHTAMLLGDIGKEARSAIPALTLLLQDDDMDVARAAKDAIEKIDLKEK